VKQHNPFILNTYKRPIMTIPSHFPSQISGNVN
jgi:hypothetical protein